MRRSSNLFNSSVFAGAMKESRHKSTDVFREAQHLWLSVQKEVKALELRPASERSAHQKATLEALKNLQTNTDDLIRKLSGAATVEAALTASVHAIKPALSAGAARHAIDGLTETFERLVPKHLSFSITRSHD